MRNIVYFVILMLVFVFISCEEDPIEPESFGSLVGEVFDKDTNLPIVGATVTTNPPSTTLLTDASGNFNFETIRTGTYSLRTVQDDYVTKLESVTIYNNQSTNIVVRMVNDSTSTQSPMAPSNPSPSDGTMDLSTTVSLSWELLETENLEDLTFTVMLFSADLTESTEVLTNSSDLFVELENLDYDATYYWQVIVDDGVNESVYGQVWGFSTMAFPDHRFLFARDINGKYDIYSSDENGNNIKITNNNSSNWRPKMNPARTKIAYISNISIEPHIYTMNRDGSDPLKITSIPISGFNNLELDFTWSSDGTYLLYMNNSKLYQVNADGSGQFVIADAITNYTFTEVDFSPTEDRLLARLTGTDSYESFIYLINFEGTYLQQIIADEAGHVGGPVYALTGNSMLYTQDITGFEGENNRQLDARIFIKDLVFGSAVDISIEKENGTNDLDASYSPDGSKIIFVNTNNDGISQKNIWKMDVDGDNRILLFENAEMPDWR